MKLLSLFSDKCLINYVLLFFLSFSFLTISINAQNNVGDSVVIPENGESFFALSVRDIDKMELWYLDLFQLTTINKIDVPDGSANIRLLRKSGLMIELLRHNEATARSDNNASFKLHGVFKVGIFVSNINEFYSTVKNRNIEIITDVITDDATGYLFFIFKDPEGNLIHIWQKN